MSVVIGTTATAEGLAGGTLPSRAAAAERKARVIAALAAARELLARDESEAAVSELHEVLTLAREAERRPLRLLLAQAYARDERWHRHALGVLRELVTDDPADGEALTTLAEIYHRNGLLARAESAYRRALAADPGSPEARHGLRAVRGARTTHRPHSPRKKPRRRGLLSRLLALAG